MRLATPVGWSVSSFLAMEPWPGQGNSSVPTGAPERLPDGYSSTGVLGRRISHRQVSVHFSPHLGKDQAHLIRI